MVCFGGGGGGMEWGQVGHHRVRKGLPAQAGRQAGQNRGRQILSLGKKTKSVRAVN